MAMPSDFVLVGAAVAALAPKSYGPILFAPLAKYTDHFGREWIDTAGRVFYYMLLVIGCSVIEKLISLIAG